MASIEFVAQSYITNLYDKQKINKKIASRLGGGGGGGGGGRAPCPPAPPPPPPRSYATAPHHRHVYMNYFHIGNARYKIFGNCVIIDIHPSKKVTQHDFDQLYLFYPGFVFIKLDIPIEILFICLSIDALFVKIVLLGARAGWVNWGQYPAIKVSTWSDFMEMRARWSCALFFCDWMHVWVPTAYSVHRSCRGFRRNACIQPQTWHCMHKFCNLCFWTLPPFYSLCTRPSEITVTNKASIERQISRVSRDIKLEEWKSRIKEI